MLEILGAFAVFLLIGGVVAWGINRWITNKWLRRCLLALWLFAPWLYIIAEAAPICMGEDEIECGDGVVFTILTFVTVGPFWLASIVLGSLMRHASEYPRPQG